MTLSQLPHQNVGSAAAVRLKLPVNVGSGNVEVTREDSFQNKKIKTDRQAGRPAGQGTQKKTDFCLF